MLHDGWWAASPPACHGSEPTATTIEHLVVERDSSLLGLQSQGSVLASFRSEDCPDCCLAVTGDPQVKVVIRAKSSIRNGLVGLWSSAWSAASIWVGGSSHTISKAPTPSRLEPSVATVRFGPPSWAARSKNLRSWGFAATVPQAQKTFLNSVLR